MTPLPPPLALPPEWTGVVDSVLHSLADALAESGLREHVLDQYLGGEPAGGEPGAGSQAALGLLGERWQRCQGRTEHLARKAQQTDAALADLDADLDAWRTRLAAARDRLDRVLGG
jgi:hypothetical protein